ncbi:helix-turn-helix domain-containing protein [Chryseobacterium sp. CT-SW4]|uniref:helix-turn-helix domain-containing protein n=1 Tax=Chryseobacterium sp. SW-1 TaxID=3157343 RepID=UPI003B011A9C
MHFYFIIGIIFRFIIISSLWKYSMASGIWLFPVILGAYIFLEKKYVYIYTGVILTGMLLINFLSDQFTIYHLEFDTCRQMILSDSFIFISNISVFCLLLYYRDKIINVQNTYCTEYMIESEKCNLYKKESCMDYEESKKYENIFLDIKRVVEDGCYYENPDFNIAQLAALLKINTGYISKAIKVSGYDNFNHYLNSCRIERVKKIIKKQDFNKITMMYVYTAAGFSNQSTFNRAFKKIEGITPSQYLNSLEEVKGKE